jgi:RNA polymerase sigma factor (sigma-70 family)
MVGSPLCAVGSDSSTTICGAENRGACGPIAPSALIESAAPPSPIPLMLPSTSPLRPHDAPARAAIPINVVAMWRITVNGGAVPPPLGVDRQQSNQSPLKIFRRIRRSCASHLDPHRRFRHLSATVSRFGKQLTGDVDELRPVPVALPRADELLPLANAAVAGDPDAAATLVLHLGGPMLRVVRKVLGRGHPDVDDVAQDAVIAFLRALNSFRGECSVVHFACRVSLLTALAARRRLRLRTRWAETDGQPIETVPDEEMRSPLATALASRRRALVHQLLDDLPDVIAESLALHFVLGYTVEEIAATLSISPNTVWSRLRLGKRALRRKLQGDAQLAEILEVNR